MFINRRFLTLVFVSTTCMTPVHADMFSWLPGKKKPAQAASTKTASQLIDETKDDLQKLREIVAKALDTGKFSAKDVTTIINRLKPQSDAIADALQGADIKTKEQLKEKATIIKLMYQALLEEAAVLELWSRGYDAYEFDLKDNFKILRQMPNAKIAVPDLKKLYEELNITTAEGKKLSFNGIRGKYQARFKELEKKEPAKFDYFYFKPYLRVLDYVFKTPYSKTQYDAFLDGQSAYDKKTKALQSNAQAIQKLFAEDLPQLGTLPSTIEAELAQ